jgi:hypothetical protein
MLSAPRLTTSSSTNPDNGERTGTTNTAVLDSTSIGGFDRHLLSLLKSTERNAGRDDPEVMIPATDNESISISSSIRPPTHHIVDGSTENDEEARQASYALDEIDYKMGVFPFYPGQGKTRGQTEIELATVDLLNGLWMKERENNRLKAELKAAQGYIQNQNTTQKSAAGLQAPGTGMMMGYVANSMLTPDETPPLPEGVKTVEEGLVKEAEMANDKDRQRNEVMDQTCRTCGRAGGSSSQSPSSATALTVSTSTRPSTELDRERDSNSSSPLSPEKELELLRAQVRDIARVCRAVAMGNLENKITVPVEGPIMSELKEVINGMVDQLKSFAGEVERVATEGELQRGSFLGMKSS